MQRNRSLALVPVSKGEPVDGADQKEGGPGKRE